MGMGADTWGPGTLVIGLGCAALIIPIFVFRHYIQDKGQFPAEMVKDLHLGKGELGKTKAGFLPYLTLLGAVAIIYVGHTLAVY